MLDFKNSPMKSVFYLCAITLAASAIRPLFFSPKTNRAYLHKIIEEGYIKKTAHALVEQAKSANSGAQLEARWKEVEGEVAAKMLLVAEEYEKSSDPYLDEKADGQSGQILATKIMRASGLM